MQNRNIADVLDDLSEVDDDLSELKLTRKALEAELLSMTVDDVVEQLSSSEYGCGTANLDIDGYKLKVIRAKKVSWNQDKLKEVRQKIIDSEANPDEYIKMELKVSETAYKNWPSNIQSAFEPARTVMPAPITFKYEREE